MTLPSEEVRALRITRDFLRDILRGPRAPQKEMRQRAASCLRHFPFDYTITKRWADEVCEHGTDRQFCRECKTEEVKR